MRDAFEACTCEACSSAITDALMLACKCICDGGTHVPQAHVYAECRDGAACLWQAFSTDRAGRREKCPAGA